MEKYVFDEKVKPVIKRFFQGQEDEVKDLEFFQNFGSKVLSGFAVVSWDNGLMTVKIGSEGNIRVTYGTPDRYSKQKGEDSWQDLMESYSGKKFIASLGKHVINLEKAQRKNREAANTAQRNNRVKTRKSVANVFQKMGISGNPKYGPSKNVLEYLGNNASKKSKNTLVNRNYKEFSGIPYRGGKKRKTRRKQRGGQSDTSIANTYPNATISYTNFEDGVDAVPRVVSTRAFLESQEGLEEPAANEQAH